MRDGNLANKAKKKKNKQVLVTRTDYTRQKKR